MSWRTGCTSRGAVRCRRCAAAAQGGCRTLDGFIRHAEAGAVEVVLIVGQEGAAVIPSVARHGQWQPRAIHPAPAPGLPAGSAHAADPGPPTSLRQGPRTARPAPDRPPRPRRRPEADGAAKVADAQSPGNQRRGQAVQGHRRHDDDEGGRQDPRCAANALGDQARGERRCGRGRDDAARGHPADERRSPFIRSVLSVDANATIGRATTTRTATRASVGAADPEQMRGHGSRDGNEQHADNQLHEGFEERAPGRNVEAAAIGQGEPHENRGDEPGVRASHVASGCYPDHGGELRGGTEHFAEPELPAAARAARCPPARRRRPRRRSPRIGRTDCPVLCGCSPQRHGIPERRDSADRMDSDPSQMRTCCSRSVGRTKLSSGPTTVGPETTRMIPSMTAAPRDIPSNGAATDAPSAQVISTPATIRRSTTLRVWPLSFRRSKPRPAS